MIILESKKKVEKKVGRLWEAQGALKSIPIESKIRKVWGEASSASHSRPKPP